MLKTLVFERENISSPSAGIFVIFYRAWIHKSVKSLKNQNFDQGYLGISISWRTFSWCGRRDSVEAWKLQTPCFCCHEKQVKTIDTAHPKSRDVRSFLFFSLSTLCPLPEPSHFSKNGKLLKCYLVEISSSFFLNLRRSAFILNVFFSEKFLFECRRWRFLVGRSEVISIIPTVSSQFEHCVRGRDTSDGLFDSRSKIVSELFCKSGILN